MYNIDNNSVYVSEGPAIGWVELGPFIIGDAQSYNCVTGGLVVPGGVGIAKNLNVCGNLTVAGTSALTGQVSVLDTALSTSPSTGALVVAGGIGVGTNLNVTATATSSGTGVYLTLDPNNYVILLTGTSGGTNVSPHIYTATFPDNSAIGNGNVLLDNSVATVTNKIITSPTNVVTADTMRIVYSQRSTSLATITPSTSGPPVFTTFDLWNGPVLTNVGGIVASGNSTFTVPVAGLYQVTLENMWWSPAATNTSNNAFTFFIVTNDGQWHCASTVLSSGTFSQTLTTSGYISMAASTSIVLQAFVSLGGDTPAVTFGSGLLNVATITIVRVA